MASGRSATTRCRKSAVSSNSRSGDCTSLSTTLLATRLQPLLFLGAVSSLPVKTTTGMSRSAGSACIRSSSSKPVMSGQPQIDDAAVERVLAQRLERLGAGADRRDLDVVVQSAARRCPARSMSLSSTTSSRFLCGVTYDLMRSNACSRSSVVPGLTRYENAPCDSPCWRSSSTDSICTGMCRVAGSSFRLFSTVQPSMSGRNTSSVIAVGRYWRASDSAVCAAVGDDALEALVARQAEQDPRVVRIVVDDQQHVVALADARRDRRATTLGLRDGEDRQRRQGSRRLLARAWPARRRGDGARRARVEQRQVQRERAALSRAR